MSVIDKRKPTKMTHEGMVAAWMKDATFRAEFDALDDEYQLLREVLLAQKHSLGY